MAQAYSRAAPPQVSPDGSWFWDGRQWQPVHPQRQSQRSAPHEFSAWVLLGLLVIDLAGYLPGIPGLTSALAALVILFADPRGLLTLNGLVKWRRLDGGLKLLVALAGIVLFQAVVAIYIGQRLFGLAEAAVRGGVLTRKKPFATVQTAADATIPAGPADADSIQRALDGLLAEAATRLRQDLLERVRAVVAATNAVLPAYRAGTLDPHDRFLVVRTAFDYLPSALHTYLKVAPAYRSVPLADADGKTASQVLCDQLDLLARRMREVAEVAYRRDVDYLLVHGRFLRSKLEPSNLGAITSSSPTGPSAS